MFQVDTDVSDIMSYATNTNHFSTGHSAANPKSSICPIDERKNLTKVQSYRLIDKHQHEQIGTIFWV